MDNTKSFVTPRIIQSKKVKTEVTLKTEVDEMSGERQIEAKCQPQFEAERTEIGSEKKILHPSVKSRGKIYNHIGLFYIPYIYL